MNEALVSDLSSMETIRDLDKCINLLDQVDNLLETNRMDIEECSRLFKLTASNNAKVKCRVWNLMVKVCEEDKDFGIMLIASLNKDLQDPNPLIRSTAVSTISSISGLDQFAVPAIRQGLEDGNPSVRIAAVTGVGKLWLHSPSSVKEHGLLDDLYNSLRDMNSTVIVFTLQTLAFLLEKEGGVVISRKTVSHFLSRLPSFPDKEFCCLTTYLALANRDLETVLEMLNQLDSYLDHENGNLVLATARLFAQLVLPHPRLQPSLVRRLCPPVVRWLKQSKKEFQQDWIRFSLGLSDDYFQEFCKEKEILRVRSKDCEELKELKIRFLSRTADRDTCRDIMNTLLNQLPSSPKINALIIQVAIDLSQLEGQVRQDCMKNLDLLIKSDPACYLPLILEADLYLDADTDKDNEVTKSLVDTILKKVDARTCSRQHLPHILALIQEFGHVTKCAPYLLEDLFSSHLLPPSPPQPTSTTTMTSSPQKSAASSVPSSSADDHVTARSSADFDGSCALDSVDLHACFLSAALALFDLYPAAVQPVLGEIMYRCAKTDNYQLHLLLRSYYHALKMKAAGSS